MADSGVDRPYAAPAIASGFGLNGFGFRAARYTQRVTGPLALAAEENLAGHSVTGNCFRTNWTRGLARAFLARNVSAT